MKKYTKPSLNILSLNGNESLCGSCGLNLISTGLAGPILAGHGLADRYLDGKITKDDFTGVFGMGETACADYPTEKYCKFEAVTLEGKVFLS